MESDQKKNILLATVAVVLLAGAALALFRDSIFSSKGPVSTPELDAAGAVNATSAGGASAPPEPVAPAVPRNSGKFPH
jgi:hypothetical protein